MNTSTVSLFTNPTYDSIQMLSTFVKKWDEHRPNTEKYKRYCKSFDKGGILLIKYNLGEESAGLCFVEDDTDDVKWLHLIKNIPDFHELYIDYDRTKHYMMCMIVVALHNDLPKSYHQLVRLKYD